MIQVNSNKEKNKKYYYFNELNNIKYKIILFKYLIIKSEIYNNNCFI